MLVVIDDQTVLFVEEIRIMFGLIKGVADFPNVIYLLAFGREIVSRSLQELQDLPGEDYLRSSCRTSERSSALKGARRSPERTHIHSERMKLQHLIIQLSRGCRCLGKSIKIANVLSRLFEDSWTVLVPWSLVSRNHRARLERLDLVERRNPFAPFLRIGLDQHEMHTVVRSVSRHDQSD
jgi:hypothetical protein